MAWYGDLRGFYGNEMIFVVGVSMRMPVTGGNDVLMQDKSIK